MSCAEVQVTLQEVDIGNWPQFQQEGVCVEMFEKDQEVASQQGLGVDPVHCIVFLPCTSQANNKLWPRSDRRVDTCCATS